MACCTRVGVGKGMGMNWANQHGLVLVGAVCGGGDSDWWIPGPVHGLEWRRRHNVADRREKKANNPDFPGLEAVTTTTPGADHAGKGAGRKRRGKKARERPPRRIEARKRDRSSTRRPDRAQASSSSVEVQQEQKEQQQQSSANAAAAGAPAAPSSADEAAAKGRGDNNWEFCGLLNRSKGIITANSGFNGTNSGRGRKTATSDWRGGEPGRMLGITRHWRDGRCANQVGGEGGNKREGAGRNASS